MNEDDRRQLIARQHRALYGSEGAPMYDGGNHGDSQAPRQGHSGAGTGARGPSPRTHDPFNRGQSQPHSAVGETPGHFPSSEQQQQTATGPSPNTQQQRSRANSNSSPASNQQGFNLFDSNAQQSSRTSTSSPGESSAQQAKTSMAPTSAGVAPIGTRPAQGQAPNPALNKRSTTPLPSPLSFKSSWNR